MFKRFYYHAYSYLEMLKMAVSLKIEPSHEKKNNNGVSEQVRHKSGCTVTEDGWKLEILDLERRGIVLSM